jgi:hypothetical protein
MPAAAPRECLKRPENGVEHDAAAVVVDVADARGRDGCGRKCCVVPRRDRDRARQMPERVSRAVMGRQVDVAVMVRADDEQLDASRSTSLRSPDAACWAAAIACCSVILACGSRSLPSSKREPLAVGPADGESDPPAALAMPTPPARCHLRIVLLIASS